MNKFVNQTKTVVLMAVMIGLFMLAGSFFGKTGLIIAFVIGAGMNIVAFFNSDKVAVAAMRGQRVDEKTAPDLVEMVSRLAKNAGLPMPKVYICPQEAPNAFATGRSPSHAAVAVTRGALRLLDYDELEGVIGHELAHVKNRDTLTSTIAATMAGALSMLGQLFWFIPIMGGDDDGPNPLAMIAFLILAPIAAVIIQAAISRSREFVADADGSKIAGTPDGLIAALQKLESTNQRVAMEHENPSQNHMFIVQPLSGGRATKMLGKLFSTHPPTEQRVAKLRALG